MVIETHRVGCLEEVYRRFHAQGRMMPAGLHYIDSWLEKDGDRCFQLMETDDPALFCRVDEELGRFDELRDSRDWSKACGAGALRRTLISERLEAAQSCRPSRLVAYVNLRIPRPRYFSHIRFRELLGGWD